MSENRLNNKVINPEEFELIVDEQLNKLNEKLQYDKWVVYPDVDLSIDDIKKHYNMSEEVKKDGTLRDVVTDVQESLNNDVQELVNEVEETVELTEEEQKVLEREKYIGLLKESHIRFHPVKHKGNVTTNQFGAAYKEKRRKKNKATNKSRKANRKK